ncbi:MAG: HAD hydrolase family protein [Bacteroidota bacterium]|nr:HAD hydrolase family protein [Bacteroidota bacterium]
MSVVAFIPLRENSKSISNKNIKSFCRKPLIYWILDQLEQVDLIDQIIVATDGDEIKDIVQSFKFNKVLIYDRDPKNSRDESSTESVILEYINSSNLLSSDTFMLVQATSPFTEKTHFNEGLMLFKKYDSVLSCCVSKKFTWRKDGTALNYDIYNRPRRQDFRGDLIENGAFYISSVSSIKKTKNRISGKIGVYQMPEHSLLEIDEKDDWVVAELLFTRHCLRKRITVSKIKIFLSDVDGVLTDGGMYYSKEGDKMKKFCTHDGMGMQLLQKKGIKVGILTSEDTDINRKREVKLNLDYGFHGIQNKLAVVSELCKKENISLDEVAYIGDDINCFNLLSNVGVSACPNNAIYDIKKIPGIIHLTKNGGEGVVREFIELLLQ